MRDTNTCPSLAGLSGAPALLAQLFSWLELLLLRPSLLHTGQLSAAAVSKPESVSWWHGPVQGRWSQQDVPLNSPLS